MSENDSEKIHAPTPRKRKRARAEGRVAKSTELVTALLVLSAIGMLSVWGQDVIQGMMQIIREGLTSPTDLSLTSADAIAMLTRGCIVAGLLFAPVVLTLFAISIAAQMLQTGALWTPDRLTPSVNHFNPSSNAGRLFSTRQAAVASLTVVKLLALTATAAWIGYTEGMAVISLGHFPLLGMVPEIFRLVSQACFRLAIALVALAALEYGLRWWQLEQDLRMTEQELREELRDDQPRQPSRGSSSSRPVTASEL